MAEAKIEFKARFKGLRNIVRRLRRAHHVIQTDTRRAFRNVGMLVQREARKNAPRLTGDLERSIQWKTGRDYVEIYVPRNSASGSYAEIRHDAKYNRGAKTVSKGLRAGRLYIKRAISDNKKQIQYQFEQVFRRV